jgi:DNA-binding NarL/FixJ family response regulator
MLGCSNKEIAKQLNISPRTVKTASADPVPAGRHSGRQRTVKLATAMFAKEQIKIMQPRERLTIKEMQVAAVVWEDQTNREIAKAIGTTEQVVKSYLRNTFDRLSVWSHLEFAIYVAQHGGERWWEDFLGRAVDIPSGTIAS